MKNQRGRGGMRGGRRGRGGSRGRGGRGGKMGGDNDDGDGYGEDMEVRFRVQNETYETMWSTNDYLYQLDSVDGHLTICT